MFLNALIDRNPRLPELALRLHSEGVLLPDSYILDLDTIEDNARMLLEQARAYGVELFFMTKQIGRNPAVCKMLMELGYGGAVVVDFREAQVMMENNIPIAHAGHLVQIPDGFLPRLLEYGVGLMTAYSIEKVELIDSICARLGKVQEIALKFYRDGDLIYPAQESGFPLEELDEVVDRLSKLKHIRLTTVTAFPCFLHDENTSKTSPVPNLETLKLAAKRMGALLGYEMKRNLPSCTQTGLIAAIASEGGSSGEPGSAFTGMTPNNCDGSAAEAPAILYLSEISHRFGGHAYCYGGGHYRRGAISAALVGDSLIRSSRLPVVRPSSDNIDYHFELNGDAPIGQAAIMCFRTQVFVTRSQVAVLSGVQRGTPRLEGIYSSHGQRLSGGVPL